MPVLDLIRTHAWLAVATLVIVAGLAAAKSPRVGGVFARVPREQRPRIVLALGVVSAALAALGHGAAGGLAPADTLKPGQVRGTSPPYGTVTIEGYVGPAPAPVSAGIPPVLGIPPSLRPVDVDPPNPDLDFSKDPKS